MLASTPPNSDSIINSRFAGKHEKQPDQNVAPLPILLQYWAAAVRWKWVIAGIVVGCLTAGLILTLLMTPKYTATSRVEISREQKNFTKVEGLETPDTGRDLEFYQTQYSLLAARSLAERVSKALRLSASAEFFNAHGVRTDDQSVFFSTVNRPLTIEERQKRERLAVELLLKNINIFPIRGSSLVDVSYTSGSPTLSQQVTNEWTRQFIESSMDRRFASTADARRFLEGRLGELRGKVETSERELVNYASRKGIVALGRSKGADGRTEVDRTLISTDLEALNDALAKSIADRLGAESKARQVPNRGATSDALGNLAIAALRQKRAEVGSEYAKLLVQFEPGYPAARALAEQVRALDASIGIEEGRVQNSRVSEYNEARNRENGLREKVEALKSRLDLQQRDSIQYNIYQREADTNRQLYDGLLQRYKEIGVAGIGANNISVVDAASTPQKPSSPNLPVNIALALFAGLGLAGLSVFGLEQIDEGLREPGQVGRELLLPLLGSVPDLEDVDAIAALNDSKSALSEAYLSVRSNLAFSTDHGVPRSFMVTSTRPAEGKSTTSLAMAMLLGRTGKRTLIIDADMRSPSIHELVNAKNVIGLSNYLAGENDWTKLVVEIGAKGLSVMPAGPMPPSAAELLSSDRMSLLVERLLENFDHVVIDAPPILGLADAPLLSQAVEGCIFVVEAEGVAMRGIKASLDRLHSVQAHIFGAILTKLKNRNIGYGYGYGYGYRYGQTNTMTD
jgi:polysaccharide biosynthesis transport protein